MQVPTGLLTFCPESQNSGIHSTRDNTVFSDSVLCFREKQRQHQGVWDTSLLMGGNCLSETGEEEEVSVLSRASLSPPWFPTVPSRGLVASPAGTCRGRQGCGVLRKSLPGISVTPSSWSRAGFSSPGRLWTEVMIWRRRLPPPTANFLLPRPRPHRFLRPFVPRVPEHPAAPAAPRGQHGAGCSRTSCCIQPPVFPLVPSIEIPEREQKRRRVAAERVLAVL